MTTYYVDPNGSNSNSGLQGSPFQTIQQAADVAKAGDTVIVDAGTYNETVQVEGNGTASAPITFEANGNVVITGGFEPANWAGDNTDDPNASGNNYVTLKGFTFDNVTDMAIRASTGWTIENVTVENSSFGINIRGNDVTVENSTFNNINGTNAHAIVGVGGSNIQILDNVIENVNTTNQTDAGNSAVTKFLYTNGLVLEGNISEGNHGPGFWLDTDNTNFTIENNTLENNVGPNGDTSEGPGLQIELNPNANGVISNNTFTGNSGAGLLIAESSGLTVSDNSFSGNAEAIAFRNMDRIADGTAVPYGQGTQYDHNITVTGNSFNGSEPDVTLVSGGDFSGWNDPANEQISFNGNIYNGPVSFGWVNPTNADAGVTYTSISQLESALGFETDPGSSSSSSTGASSTSAGATGSTSTNTDPPASTSDSTDPTTVLTPTSGGTATDGSGNIWTVTADGHVTENGTVDPKAWNVGDLIVYQGNVYLESNDGPWYEYGGSPGDWVSLSASPVATATGSDPAQTTSTGTTSDSSTSSSSSASSSGVTTLTPTSGGTATDGSGDVWTVTADGHVTDNGTVDPTAWNVADLVVYQGHVYLESNDGPWYEYGGSPGDWTSIPGNPASGSTESTTASASSSSSTSSTSSGTETTTTLTTTSGGTATDGTGDVWTVTADGHVTENGTVDPTAWNVADLVVYQGDVYLESNDGPWYEYGGKPGDWVSISGSPLASTSAASSTNASSSSSTGTESPIALTTTSGGTATDGSGNAWTVTANGHITENGTTDPVANNVGELVVDNGNVYLQSNDGPWYEYGGTPGHWTSIASDPFATAASTTASTTSGSGSSTPTLSPVADGAHNVYVVSSPSQAGSEIADFNPATDYIDIAPLLKAAGYTGQQPLSDVIALVQTGTSADPSTAVMFDPNFTDPAHGETLVTLENVAPNHVSMSDIIH